jgi:hypothetical protein
MSELRFIDTNVLLYSISRDPDGGLGVRPQGQTLAKVGACNPSSQFCG